MGNFSLPEERFDKLGKWVLFKYNARPAAQVFVPIPHKPTSQFSFFWLGVAQLYTIQQAVELLLQEGTCTVEGRLIGPSHLTTFSFAPWADSLGANWDTGLVRHLLHSTGSPASVGLTIKSNTCNSYFPSSFYLWASIGGERGHDWDQPEIGIKMTIDDWNARAMRDIFLPVLTETSMIEDEADSEWLWNQVAVTVDGMMQGN